MKKHENYEILNLIGYGLAKFDKPFIKEFSFKSKTEFYNYFVEIGIVKTESTVKNRQDLFDPFFNNDRKGWWQKGDAYKHRKIKIDLLYENLEVKEFSEIIKTYINKNYNQSFEISKPISPISNSKYKLLQETGIEAELFFMNNYQEIPLFKGGALEDARIFGDGYDFQIDVLGHFYLAEIKGIKNNRGNLRLTEKEYVKAKEFKDDYGLIVVSNLSDTPKISTVFNPYKHLELTKSIHKNQVISYHSKSLNW